MIDHYTELAEAFVLGTLHQSEERQFVQHLKTGCAECRRAVETARQVTALLPYIAPQNEPPPELKSRLLTAIAAEENLASTLPKPEALSSARATIRSLPQRTFFQRVQGPLAWAAVFLLVAISYGYFLQKSVIVQLRQQLAAQAAQLNEREVEIKLLQFEMVRQQTVIHQIQQSNASHLLLVNLQSTEAPSPPGSVKVLLDPQTAGGSFIAYNLPPLTEAHDYQLWFILDGKPIDAGVFAVDAKGEFIGVVKHLPATLTGIAAFAITREPKGGRPTPTMPIYWLGNVIRA